MTPFIAGGSLAGILNWRARLAVTPGPSRSFRLNLGRKKEESEDSTGSLAEEEIKAVVKQVLAGLVYLHDRGYIHVGSVEHLEQRSALIISGISKLATF